MTIEIIQNLEERFRQEVGTSFCDKVICPNCGQPMKQKLFTLVCEILQGRTKDLPAANVYACQCGTQVEASLNLKIISPLILEVGHGTTN